MPRLIDRSIGWLAPFPGCFIEIFFAFSKLFLASDLDFITFCLRGLNNEGTVRGERERDASEIRRTWLPCLSSARARLCYFFFIFF